MISRFAWSHLAILMTTCSFVGTAVAQENQPSGVETVEVSASRITTNGFSAPTPVTVLGAADIEANAQPSITNALVQLPALTGSRTTQVGNSGVSAGGNGIQSLGLRNLGNNRTLVLLNGQRIIPAATDGTVDVGQLPQGLMQRVDVVTGGASASWGSDAVAGVVNFILDKKFEGFKANFSGGISDYGDDANGLVELTAGTSFARGKGHIEGTVGFNTSDGVPRAIGSRTWYNATNIVQQTIAQTPAGSPQYLYRQNVSVFQFTQGGIITAGPLKGITFGNGGAVSNFNYGTTIGTYMIGGEKNQIGDLHSGLDPAEKRGSFYGRVSYDVSPNATFYADFMYGMEHNRTLSVANEYQAANLTMNCSNPFLPSSVASACTTNKITSFQYGTNVHDLNLLNADGGDNAVVTRTMRRITAGGNGVVNAFGTDWSWDVYGEHGWNDVSDHLTDMLIIPLFKQAIDVNTSAAGTPQCANATARSQGCLPLNIFGYNVADPRALSWVEGNSKIGPFLNTQQREEMVSLAINGEPWKNWAGNISTAFGLEYREEAAAQQDDGLGSSNVGNPLLPPYANNNSFLSTGGNNWHTGNFRAAPSASYHVVEAFAETVIPLLKGSSFGDADLNLAGRATQYSGAGYVSTWKVGLTYEPSFVDGVKFRALQSRDVRAPNLGELAPVGTTGYGFIIADSPPYAGQSFNVYGTTAGNPNLKPEKGQTTELGIVYAPSWFPGFNASIDYYRIALKGGVGQLSTQQVVDSCYQGNASACNLITLNSAGQPTAVLTTKLNLASIVTDGVDYEASYQADVADFVSGVPGRVTIRALASNATKFITTSGQPNTLPLESAGDNSGNLPHWKGFLSESYSADKWSVTLFQRMISVGTLPRNWIQCTTGCPAPTVNNPTIDYNRVAGAFYLDVGGTYNLTSYSQLYFKVDNLTNLDPPMAPSNSFFRNGSNPGLYDTIGRFYRIGVRITTD